MAGTDRYSLWLRPKDEAAAQLQALIRQLAAEYDAPAFVPHLTLVGRMQPGADEERKIDALAGRLSRFTITLTQYGFMDEKERCLYLQAQSPQLDAAYGAAAAVFPQAAHEHFRAMPHLSLLYGHYPPAVKEKIMADNPFRPLTFEATSLDLYLTTGPADTWREVYSAPLHAA